MRFTQTLQRSKDIYECYNLDDEKEENEEENLQLLHFICFSLK